MVPSTVLVKKTTNPSNTYCFTAKLLIYFGTEEVLSWIAIYKDEVVEISLIDVLFGQFDIDKDFKAINHLLLLAKFYIYGCKLDKIHPTIDVFRVKVRANYNLELFIAKKNDALLKHYTKWELFISILY